MIGLGLAVLGLLLGVGSIFAFHNVPTAVVGFGLLAIGLIALK